MYVAAQKGGGKGKDHRNMTEPSLSEQDTLSVLGIDPSAVKRELPSNYRTDDEPTDLAVDPSKTPFAPGLGSSTAPPGGGTTLYAPGPASAAASVSSRAAVTTTSTMLGGVAPSTVLSQSKYAEIASAVAGRLGYEFYGRLFSYLDMEQERAYADRMTYASRATLIKAMSEKAMVATPQDLASITAQIHATSAIAHMMPRECPGSVSSGITPRTEGALGLYTKPTTLLKANVQFAASLVAIQLRRRDINWQDVWNNGDSEVRSMFAELVALCIADSLTRTRDRTGAGAEVARYATSLQRRNEVLRTFSLLYSDSGDGRWHFDYSTRAFDYSRNIDTSEAALNFVGY